MTDISTNARTSANIFKAIMDSGPLTLYSANQKTRIPIGTIHRHLKMLKDSDRIRIYDTNKKGRKKIEYGPTIYGMIRQYIDDKKFADKIENYFLIWIEQKEFVDDLRKEGFDISHEKLRESKSLFRKYMEYFSAVEKQIERIREGKDSISRDIMIILSSQILSSNNHYQKLWTELYESLPGMQKSLDEYMDNMIKSYRKFKSSKKNSPSKKQSLQK